MRTEMRGRDLLIGCGLGCLGVVVLGIAGCVGFRVWLDAPAEVLEPERLLAGDTAGHLELRLGLDDPSTVRFLEQIVAQTEPPETRDLPSWARRLIELQNRRRLGQMRDMLPAVLAWTLTPGPDGEDRHLISLSSEGIGNRLTLARWILGLVLRRSGDVQVVEYRGVSLLRLPPSDGAEPVLVLRRGDLHYASAPEVAERAVDRLVDGPRDDAGAASELEAWFEALPADRPLRGAIGNERGELARLLRRLQALPDDGREVSELAGVRVLTVSGGFADGPSLEGTLEILGPSSRWAEENAGELAELLTRDWGELRPTLGEPLVVGERIRMSFSLVVSKPLAEPARTPAVEAPPERPAPPP